MGKTLSLIKWPGGKRKISKEIFDIIENNENIDENTVFIDVFCGSLQSSMPFIKKYPNNTVIANDLNDILIIFYNTVKKNPYELINQLEILKKQLIEAESSNINSKFYYDMRNRFNELKTGSHKNKIANQLELSVIFLYLNKHGYNGLYRENKKGEYNVPFGKRKNIDFVKKNDIIEFSNIIKNVVFLNLDYKELVDNYREGDSVIFYFDPPYFSTFNQYVKQVDGNHVFDYMKFSNYVKDNIKYPYISDISKDENIFDIYDNFKCKNIGKESNFIINTKTKNKKQEIIFYKERNN